MRAGSVDAVLMASGFSRRFGEEDKLLADFCGASLAERTLGLAVSVKSFGSIFFVAARESVLSLARAFPVLAVKNDHPELGQRESMRLGILNSKAEYYMFFPCDQPFLDSAAILAVINERRPGKIVQPVFKGRPGSPSLFSASFREDILSLSSGEHGRDIKKRNFQALINVEIDSSAPFTDIDTKAELLYHAGRVQPPAAR